MMSPVANCRRERSPVTFSSISTPAPSPWNSCAPSPRPQACSGVLGSRKPPRSLNDTNVRPTLPHTTNPSSPLPPHAPPPWIDLWLRNTRHVLLARCRSWRMQHLRQASTSKHTSFRREKWPNSKGPVPSRWRTRIRPALRQRLMSSPRKKSLPARTWKPSKKFAALASALKNTRVRAEVGQPRPRTIRRRALAPAKKPREEGPRAAATAAAVVGE
mmetsp:Transcript_16440/g.48134  ORF Transcript_16440/g.48134 Transcript_16440/m.48134 type:complete len:216 (+) Transcript_16440:1453-2100(+)